METFVIIFVSSVYILHLPPIYDKMDNQEENNIAVADERLKQVLESAFKMFMRYGLKSVTMDDIAKALGMSKKTLYVYFKDKNDVILKTLQYSMENHQCSLDTVYDQQMNAIDESFEVFRIVTNDLQEITPTVFYDLKKYYPDVYKIYEEYEMHHIPEIVGQNLTKGIEEGYYRRDLNTQIISLAYTHMIRSMFETDSFATRSYNFATIYLNIFQYHIQGIASSKGLEYLDKKMKNLNIAP